MNAPGGPCWLCITSQHVPVPTPSTQPPPFWFPTAKSREHKPVFTANTWPICLRQQNFVKTVLTCVCFIVIGQVGRQSTFAIKPVLSWGNALVSTREPLDLHSANNKRMTCFKMFTASESEISERENWIRFTLSACFIWSVEGNSRPKIACSFFLEIRKI